MNKIFPNLTLTKSLSKWKKNYNKYFLISLLNISVYITLVLSITNLIKN